MKDLVRYIVSVFSKKNTATEESPEVPEEHSEIENSGSITFSWDSVSGDFEVLTQIEDYGESSSEVLGMLLSYISEGRMKGFLLQSLKLWSMESSDKDKGEHFYMDVLRVWNMMNEIDEGNSSQESPLISPIDVFRLSRRDNSV